MLTKHRLLYIQHTRVVRQESYQNADSAMRKIPAQGAWKIFLQCILLDVYSKLLTKLYYDKKKICENVMYNKTVTLKTFFLN
jgi:hypothetical protein